MSNSQISIDNAVIAIKYVRTPLGTPFNQSNSLASLLFFVNLCTSNKLSSASNATCREDNELGRIYHAKKIGQ